MSLKLPRLARGVPIVDIRTGVPTETFVIWWDRVATALENQEATQDGILDEQAEQLALILETLDIANEALENSEEALAGGGEMSPTASLQLSYPADITITAADVGADVLIAISAHTRRYGNGDEVAVSSGNQSPLPFDTMVYIYYDDASRAGGAVTYASSFDFADALSSTANPNRHYIGEILTPSDGGADTVGIPATRS